MGDLIKFDSRQLTALKHIIESMSQIHTDLSELCCVVCTTGSPCLSQNAYEDIQDIKDRLESLCDQLEAPPEGTTFEDAYEESNLALAFLSALIITMWATGNPPTMRPLEWRESMMIYAVLFSTMHRLENAFITLKTELYEGARS